MKRIILILIIILVIVFIISLSKEDNDVRKEKNEEVRGIFISYIELTKYVKGYKKEDIKINIDKMLDNITSLGFNTIYLQIRSFNDSIYKSNIFPSSSTIVENEGDYIGIDILEYYLKRAHKKGIKLYGWMNPYRVRSNDDISSIKEVNPAFNYINTDTLYISNGIYLNPAKKEVEDLIVEAVEEVVKNYDIDGIIFDDYFYPGDNCSYNDYLEYSKSNYITESDYYLMIINNMIERVHKVVNKYNKVFGISPDGNINNNYNKNYADIKTWLSSDKYIDFIMPQIYYGFYNQNQAFNEVINTWNDLIINKNIDLHIALAFYKVGLEDKWALSGSNEWIDNDDIIMREIILCRNLKQYKGFSLFRYDYLFNTDLYNQNTFNEIENMKKVLN